MIQVIRWFILACLATSAYSSQQCTDDNVYETFADTATSPDPTKYYVCLSNKGNAVERKCPAGLVYNEEVKGCSWAASQTSNDKCPSDINGGLVPKIPFTSCETYGECSAVGDTPVVSTTGCSPGYFNSFSLTCESNWYCETSVPDCESKNYAEKLPIVGDRRSYYECRNGSPSKLACPAGHCFDRNAQLCLLEDDSVCKQPIVSIATATKNDVCKDVTAPTFVADPKYCKGYYYCVNQKQFTWGSCGDRYFENGYCVSTKPSRCTCEDYDLPSEGKIRVPHADKTKYIICKKGEFPSIQDCDKGFIFSSEEGLCVPGV